MVLTVQVMQRQVFPEQIVYFLIYSLFKYFPSILYLMYLSPKENLGGCGSRVGLWQFVHFS